MDIKFIDTDRPLRIDDSVWKDISSFKVKNDWRGMPCEEPRHFDFQLAWTKSCLTVRFTAPQNDECVIASDPILDSKTIGLWNRDVCEIFIAPDSNNPHRYFEFEIAPTGEWVDLELSIEDGRRKTNVEYSGDAIYEVMDANGRDVMMISIPWQSLEIDPVIGNSFKGNIFRCTGKDPDRCYLSYRPTMTDVPNFHVPEAFAEFRLTD